MALRTTRKTFFTTTSSFPFAQCVPAGPRRQRQQPGIFMVSRNRQRQDPRTFQGAAQHVRVSRIQEKKQPAHLNDKLAAHIDKVRNLETENSRLTKQIETSQETRTREVTSVKNMYERELGDLRRAVDMTAAEKAKLQMDAKKWQTEAEALQARLTKRERDWSAAEWHVASLGSQKVDLQGRLNQALAQLKDAESERDVLAKALDELKKQLDAEVLHSVDLKNCAKTLNEQLDFQKNLYEKELQEVRVVKQTKITEFDGGLKERYEQKLEDTLRELREQYEMQMRLNHEEMEEIYESNICDLQDLLERCSKDSSSTIAELRSYKSHLEVVNSRISELKSQNMSLASRVRDLDRLLDQKREWHDRAPR